MQYRRWRPVLLIFVLGLGSVAILRITFAARNGSAPIPEQDVIRLESRFSQLETRLNFIESRLRSIEQQSRISDSRGISPTDLAVLRSELQALQQRVAEHECALAKLDERTLATNVRAARRRADPGNDPCRSNSDTPIRLPGER